MLAGGAAWEEKILREPLKSHYAILVSGFLLMCEGGEGRVSPAFMLLLSAIPADSRECCFCVSVGGV